MRPDGGGQRSGTLDQENLPLPAQEGISAYSIVGLVRHPLRAVVVPAARSAEDLVLIFVRLA